MQERWGTPRLGHGGLMYHEWINSSDVVRKIDEVSGCAI